MAHGGRLVQHKKGKESQVDSGVEELSKRS